MRKPKPITSRKIKRQKWEDIIEYNRVGRQLGRVMNVSYGEGKGHITGGVEFLIKEFGWKPPKNLPKNSVETLLRGLAETKRINRQTIKGILTEIQHNIIEENRWAADKQFKLRTPKQEKAVSQDAEIALQKYYDPYTTKRKKTKMS